MYDLVNEGLRLPRQAAGLSPLRFPRNDDCECGAPLKMSNQSQIRCKVMIDSEINTLKTGQLYDFWGQISRKSGRTQTEPKALLTTQLLLTRNLAFLAFSNEPTGGARFCGLRPNTGD